jgi:hypothetical protein
VVSGERKLPSLNWSYTAQASIRADREALTAVWENHPSASIKAIAFTALKAETEGLLERGSLHLVRDFLVEAGYRNRSKVPLGTPAEALLAAAKWANDQKGISPKPFLEASRKS